MEDPRTSTQTVPRANRAERDLARCLAQCAQLQAYSLELEWTVAELKDKCRELEKEKAAVETRYNSVVISQVTLEQVLVEYGKQQDEIERLELELLNQRRRAMAAICILQGHCVDDEMSSQTTTIVDADA
jgi:predicted RNase H-like nuclease (RuvC/YqgF family)